AVEPRLPRVVQPPVRRGQSLGDVVVRRGDQELGRVAVIADRDVAAAGWLSWLWDRGASAPAAPQGGAYALQTSGVTSSASTMSEAPESKSTRTSVRPMFSHV